MHTPGLTANLSDALTAKAVTDVVLRVVSVAFRVACATRSKGSAEERTVNEVRLNGEMRFGQQLTVIDPQKRSRQYRETAFRCVQRFRKRQVSIATAPLHENLLKREWSTQYPRWCGSPIKISEDSACDFDYGTAWTIRGFSYGIPPLHRGILPCTMHGTVWVTSQ